MVVSNKSKRPLKNFKNKERNNRSGFHILAEMNDKRNDIEGDTDILNGRIITLHELIQTKKIANKSGQNMKKITNVIESTKETSQRKRNLQSTRGEAETGRLFSLKTKRRKLTQYCLNLLMLLPTNHKATKVPRDNNEIINVEDNV